MWVLTGGGRAVAGAEWWPVADMERRPVAGARRLDRLGGSGGRPVAERLGGSVAGAVPGGVDWPVAERWPVAWSGGGVVVWPGDCNIGGEALLARRRLLHFAKCERLGKKEEGRRLLYPSFSPGWWLQPGLKGGL
jgi:hypothetical protein